MIRQIKYLLPVLFILFTIVEVKSQERRYIQIFTKDQLSFSFGSTQLLHSDNSLEISPFSRGVNIKLMYPIFGNKRNVDFAIGGGFSSQNYYLNSYISTTPGELSFIPFPSGVSYKKYKLNTNYLMVPVELRFRTNPDQTYRSFKFYPGFRFAYLISDKTKYIGDNLITGIEEKVKIFDYPHLAKYDYGVTLRVGYGKLLLHAYYSLSELLDPGKGIELKALEVGITAFIF